MTESDIAHAKARAEDVVNGFTQVRTQQARDVIRLANELRAADKRLEALERKLFTMEQKSVNSSVFETIFGAKK